MCGRLSVTLPTDAMAQLFAATPDNDLPVEPNYNVCPTVAVHVVSGGESGRRLRAMRWGFVPSWYKALNGGPLLINARAETIAQKPAFKAACRARRCLIPASGFYEWTKTPEGARLPWYIARKDNAPLALAGIWQDWEQDSEQEWEQGVEKLSTCAIVTVAADAQMQAIHHRMPLALEAAHWAKWLGEEGKGAAVLMEGATSEALSFYRVGMDVNSNRASGAGLIAPL